MKITPWFLTLTAFLTVAVLSVGFIFKKLNARPEAPVAVVEVDAVPMLVADVPAGTTITQAHLAMGRWRVRDLAPESFRSFNGIVGRVTAVPIPSATPLMTTQFLAPGDTAPLQISPGHQAVTVDVADSTAMVGGLIKPGDFVDVHMTVSGIGASAGDITNVASATGGSASRSGDAMTMTLFRSVRVIAINRSTTTAAAGRGGNDVTLELVPDQARSLLLARSRGEIALTYTIEEHADATQSDDSANRRVTLQDILGLEIERPFVTEQFRQGNRTEIRFDGGRQIPVGSGVPNQTAIDTQQFNTIGNPRISGYGPQVAQQTDTASVFR